MKAEFGAQVALVALHITIVALEIAAVVLQVLTVALQIAPQSLPVAVSEIVGVMVVSAATISIIAITATTQERVRAFLEIQLGEVDASQRMAIAVGNRPMETSYILCRKSSALLQLLDAVRDRSEELSAALRVR